MDLGQPLQHHARCRRAPGRLSLAPGPVLPPFPLPLERGRRRGHDSRLDTSLGHGSGPGLGLGLGLGLLPELEGKVQGGLQGGENDFSLSLCPFNHFFNHFS